LLGSVVQLAVKIGKIGFDKDSLGFRKSTHVKAPFKALFGLLEATFSSEYSTSAVNLVPKHIYLPLGVTRQLPFPCLFVSLGEIEVEDQIVGLGQVQKSKEEVRLRASPRKEPGHWRFVAGSSVIEPVRGYTCRRFVVSDGSSSGVLFE